LPLLHEPFYFVDNSQKRGGWEGDEDKEGKGKEDEDGGSTKISRTKMTRKEGSGASTFTNT